MTGSMGVVIAAAGVLAVAFFNWMYDHAALDCERFARLVRKVEGKHGSNE